MLAAARPVVEVGTVRARGFVVFRSGHATGCLGADARKHRRIVVRDVLCLLSLSGGVSTPTILACRVRAVAMGCLATTAIGERMCPAVA